MFRTLAVTATAAVLAGCATGSSQQASSALDGENLVGKRVAVTTQPPPPLKAGSVGDDLRASYDIGDPAARIGRGVALSLVTERGMTLLLDDGAEADADYVIDVQTREWALDTYPLSRSRYRLKYDARLRLIGRADGRVLAESSCRSEQGDIDHPPTGDELVADGAALVKGYLEMATAACVDLAVRETLRLREAGEPVVAAAGAVTGTAAPEPVRSARAAVDFPAAPVPVAAATVARGADRSVTRESTRNAESRMVARPAPQAVAAPAPRQTPRPQQRQAAPRLRTSPQPPPATGDARPAADRTGSVPAGRHAQRRRARLGAGDLSA